ncbi:MAG: hypothetical protein AAF899_16965 [Pseudomonadota bacterium]
MYARISLFRTKAEHNNAETRASLQASLPERLKTVPGLKQCFLLGMEEDGRTGVIAVFESEEALLAATEEIETLWFQVAHLIEGEIVQHGLPVFLHTDCATGD